MPEINNERIWLSPPHMCGEEQKLVAKAFETNWIAPLGPYVDQFEQHLSQFTHSPFAVALSSGTAALHLALINLGVGKGDYVLCPSFTFSASANPIIYQGAIPVFLDSESFTWNMDPSLLRNAILKLKAAQKKIKCIILVHLYGMPAQLNEIAAIANEFQIPIIEDAAESLGSLYNDKHTGTFGSMGILSFNGNKIITTSGGGALLTHDAKVARHTTFLSTQARDQAPHYEHSHIGYNYRLSNVCAAIGVGQLSVIEERIKARRSNYDYYKQGLSSIEEITFLDEPPLHFSNRWLTTITLSQKSKVSSEAIRLALAERNIEARPLWKPMHLQPVFKHCDYFGNGICDNLFLRGICLPSGSSLSDSQKDNVIQTIKQLYN